MSRLALVLALALPLALPGCAFWQGEGEEVLSIVNRDVQPVQIVVEVIQHAGQFPLFGESLRLGPGDSQDYPIAMRPGDHTVRVTTSTSLQEALVVQVPEKGDSVIEILLRRGMATITMTTTN